MYAHEYGKKHFKHKTNFYDLVVFSDVLQQKMKDDEVLPSQSSFLEIEKGVINSDKWLIHLNSRLSGEYGNFFLQNNPTPAGETNLLQYEQSDESYTFIQEHILDFQDGVIPYYKINEKFYIQLDASINLDEDIITAKTSQSKGTKEKSVELDAFVTLFASEDGARLEHAYQSITDINAHEVIIFVERDSGTNAFGTVFRVKKGANVKTLLETDRMRVAQIARAYGINIAANELSTMIQEELKHQSEFYFLLSKALTQGGRIVRWGVGETLTAVSGGLKTISKEIDDFKLGDDRWKAYIDGKENPKFNSLLPNFPDDGIIATEELANKIYKTYISPLESKAMNLTATLKNNPFLNKVVQFDGSIITKTIQKIPELLHNFFKTVGTRLKQLYNFINGLLVGIINSIIEFIKSIFDIIAMLIDVLNGVIQSTKFFSNPGSYISLFIESFENLIDVVVNSFTLQNLKAFVSFIANLPKQAYAAVVNLANNTSEISIDTGSLGYYLGFFVGFIASEVLTFFATGGTGNIANGLKKVFQSYKELAKITGKAIQKTVTFGIDTFLKLIKNIVSFSKNIPKHLDTLKTWIDEFVTGLQAKITLIDNVAYSFVDPFTVLGKTFFDIVRRNAWRKLNNLGVSMLKSGKDTYSFSYNGKNIAEGLIKTEAEEFLAEILIDVKKYPQKNIEEYLDELVDVVNKSRIIGFKLKPMLRKYLGEDVGIHPYTGEKSFFDEVIYFDDFLRSKHEVFIKNNRLINKEGDLFDSLDIDNILNNGKAIFVMDETGRIFASKYPDVGMIHHSSFLGGRPVVMAGEIEVYNGYIVAINNATGHYWTSERHLKQFLSYLEKKGIDIKDIKLDIIK